MIHKVFSVYDSKAEAYMPPFFAATKGIALRMFADAVNDKSTSVNKHPSDYVLFEVGTFDDSKGVLISMAAPTSLGVALEFVNDNQGV